MKQYQVENEDLFQYESQKYMDSFKDSDFITQLLIKEGVITKDVFTDPAIYKTGPNKQSEEQGKEQMFRSSNKLIDSNFQSNHLADQSAELDDLHITQTSIPSHLPPPPFHFINPEAGP